MRKTAVILGIPLMLLAALVVLMTLGRFERPSAAASGDSAQDKPRYTVTGAQWTRIGSDGKTEFHVDAERIDYYDDQSARLQNLAMDGFADNRGPWRLTSPRGEMPAHDPRILLTKPVVITGAPKPGVPVRMTTDQLWVDSGKRQLYTDAPVQLVRGPQQASANGLNADWAGQRLQLLHDVKVTYVPNG
ncbi:MAG: LPS export ABC transporter periplasmic protein LptC [Nevskiaceae bacterium]|nr:MAG: LPS export ABC transporter periplasmic protein LptC [Nevskiaceae bacterium]